MLTAEGSSPQEGSGALRTCTLSNPEGEGWCQRQVRRQNLPGGGELGLVAHTSSRPLNSRGQTEGSEGMSSVAPPNPILHPHLPLLPLANAKEKLGA